MLSAICCFTSLIQLTLAFKAPSKAGVLVEDIFTSRLSDRWEIEVVRNGACKRQYKANGEAGGLGGSRLQADSQSQAPKMLV